jgi:hypothetical protein
MSNNAISPLRLGNGLENWQVQEEDGTSVSDHLTKEQAQHVAFNLSADYQRSFIVKRTI